MNPDETRPKSGWIALFREALGGTDHDFSRGDLRRAIPLLAIPMVLEMSMEAVFAVVDVFWVGRLGADAVATVGLTESVMTLVYAMAFGLAMSTTACFASPLAISCASPA